ncbi:BTB/POZ domain-containing protein [Rhizophagus irregularis DAOM 181602=DAOM 197198]|uniref:Kelch-like protein 17 n=3 Tax=Rhizophagus irregularis TaxID=588596 RepID=A0A015KE22_RHIIW|nr:hypothetical protein GLOIN_2v1848585 [Rhizophagus irregularis DAOM 181602=DAOM 197198]EXX77865.1 hypothetical protein RirG_019930 [Rhizophagus irregularis DAOM 197198w]POG58776.1 hypothetical protein GLOIN_2v1848585 [Rhizophagus irregularis DAOM 181602=DAOM 197198]GBC45471.1 BTB/POZ domain-containing protein [Rhizophagus irregularis DAOM 181602=DAOM 197198]|eukprot:XP_025165642.1 hypothetical protein GLOIN_2v1848585 [Rhizophagus irregularis DAOM 181602=DAOM 197198]
MSRKLVTRAFSKFKTKEPKEVKDNDVIIYVGKEPDFKEFQSNSKIMRSKSDYFKRILSDKNIEKKDEKYVIKIPDATPQVFNVIIKYLSTGKINVKNKTGIEILNVMITSDELKLNQLIRHIEDSLIENQNFLQDDPVEVLQMVYYNKSLGNNIQEFCLKSICFEPKNFFNSAKFVNLPAPLLEIILNRDDLNLIEIKIWENLIKWGLAQEKTLNEDVSKWNQDNFNTFEKIIHKFIPLIRFYDISSEDYFYKVRPLEKILPKEIKGEILKFYMIPGYTPNNILLRNSVDSVLINTKHTLLFANWIDRKKGKVNYKLILLYRASRDGNSAEEFHTRCDNKGATIVVVKIENSEQIVGGYNSLLWNSSGENMSTKDNFIFSFTDKTNLQSAKVVYSNGDQYSVRYLSNYGPAFGNFDLYVDYNIATNIWYSRVSSYPTLNLPNTMKVVDYEVFRVIKN